MAFHSIISNQPFCKALATLILCPLFFLSLTACNKGEKLDPYVIKASWNDEQKPNLSLVDPIVFNGRKVGQIENIKWDEEDESCVISVSLPAKFDAYSLRAFIIERDPLKNYRAIILEDGLQKDLETIDGLFLSYQAFLEWKMNPRPSPLKP